MLRIIPKSASTTKQHQYVPLKQVSVEANIHSFAADVTIKQVFHNDETIPIEAVYCFPIEEHAAVYAFIAQIDDQQIIAQLKEKQQAQQQYNNALQQGSGAYLLEQDEKSQDNFIINVGALPPGKQCHIQISYVTELDLVQNGTKIQFVVPTAIAPRYNSDKGSVASPAGTTTNYVQSTPYTIDFRCHIDKVDIARVSSTSHPIQVDFSQQDVYVITFAQQNIHLDRDILIDIELSENRSNTIVAVESGAAMASFTPNEQDCQHAMNNTETTNEFIFVVDCSGSMKDENKIGFARQAMILFLKSLPLNCHFNIIRFGSTYETLFKDITDIYNKENAQQAEQLTNNMQADLGGTELLLPLQWLEEHSSKEGRTRQIFLLTDGEISQVNEVIDLCRSMSNSTRIFSFGLGRSPSRSLVKGLARSTNGHFVFIPPETNVDVYVGEQLEKALQSSISNIQVKWNFNRKVMNVPTTMPPVYANHRLIVYALTHDDDNSELCLFDHNSSVELYNDKHRLGEAKVSRIPSVSDNRSIARLAAKTLILELQHSKLSSSNKKNGSQQIRFEEQAQKENEKLLNNEKEDRKKRIIELSLKYNILSPYTTFIGIEQRVNGNNDDMALREVPIQVSPEDQRFQMRALQRQQKIEARQMELTQKKLQLERMREMKLAAKLGQASSDSENNIYTTYSCVMSASLKEKPAWMLEIMNECETVREQGSACQTSAASSNSTSSFCDTVNDHSLRQEAQGDVNNLSSVCDKSSVNSSNNKNQKEEDIFPADDQNIVRYLISKQAFDGLWNLDSKDIEQLTGKPLSHFQRSTDVQVLISAIVVLVLETRFASFSSMWHGVVQKTRKSLLDLLGNDNTKLNTLFEDIHKQF